MWIYASSVALKFQEGLEELFDELRTDVVAAPQTLERTFQWGDVDYTFGGSISATPAPVVPGAALRPVTVRPQVWYAVHPLVIGRTSDWVLSTEFRGVEPVTWMLCHQVGGRDLAVVDGEPYFVVDLHPSRQAQEAATPDAAAVAASVGPPCDCAQPAGDGRPCDGPRDLVRVLDGEAELRGCYSHAVDVMERSPSATVEPGSTPGYTAANLTKMAQGVARLAESERRRAAADLRAAANAAVPAAAQPAPAPWWRRLRRPRP